jgi:hypothetical protein
LPDRILDPGCPTKGAPDIMQPATASAAAVDIKLAA